MKVFWTFLCFSIAFISSALRAETVANLEQAASSQTLRAYVSAKPFLQQLFQVSWVWDQTRGALCETGDTQIDPLGFAELLMPIVFDKQGQITSGGAVLVFSAKRCNRTMYYRILMAMKPGEKLQLQALIPGDSAAELRLFLDSFGPIRAGSLTSITCKEWHLLDTLRVKMEKIPDPQKIRETIVSIKEIWWFGGCGKKVAMDVHFFENSKLGGMSYAATQIKKPNQYVTR